MTSLTREDEERAAAIALILLGSQAAETVALAHRTTIVRRAKRAALRDLETLAEPFRTLIREAIDAADAHR